MPVIKPTVGRVVWYRPGGKSDLDSGRQPFAATIAFVHGDNCINIGYLDPNGNHCRATSVRLVQEGEELPATSFCQWMPFQLGQAAKTEKAEAAAKA